MKLYTEEDLIHICLFISEYYNYNEEEIKEIIKQLYLTPIELPSDEEIKNFIGSGMHNYYAAGFDEGAKWMKEQILNQNK